MLISWTFRLMLPVFLLQACVTKSHPEVDVGRGTETHQSLPDLALEPLPPAISLTHDYFRKSYPHLSAQQFDSKWANAQASGLLFIRSFVNTWYDELDKISKLGPIGPCFGDPHPENFGFLAFGTDGFKYVYDDGDDSGACPVAFDALRYFTALKLYLADPIMEQKLRRSYIHFLNGEKLADLPSKAFAPELKEAWAKSLKKTVVKGKIKLDRATLGVSPAIAQSLFDSMRASLPDCKDCKLLDAAQIVVSSGGSAGLMRYWLLVQTSELSPMLIEFKELIEPASQRGGWAQSMRINRTQVLSDAWQSKIPSYFGFTTWQNKNYLIRSRVKTDIELGTLAVDQRQAVLTEQVYLLAQLHRKVLVGNGLLEEWLGQQSDLMARRYGEALLAAKGG